MTARYAHCGGQGEEPGAVHSGEGGKGRVGTHLRPVNHSEGLRAYSFSRTTCTQRAERDLRFEGFVFMNT
jgi:hypothetical protein